MLFVSGGRVYRADSDGHDLTPVTPAGQTSLSPGWSPDGQRIAYTQLGEGRGGIVVQTLSSGATFLAPGSQTALNITPAFSPDGRTLAFAHSDERGTDIYTANVTERCCAQRLTVGRFADNLSPTFSPDGRRIAFISTRAGPPQLYVMAADGTDQELLAPFDFGATGSSNAPEWSPDGASVVFHREVSGSPQIFLVDVSGRRVRQLTSSGRNEDPTWAPDGRHVAFISDRSGRRQIWIVDIETGRVRQLATPRRRSASVVVAPPRADHHLFLTHDCGVMMRAPSLLMLLAAAAFTGACGGKPAPEEPAPEPTPAAEPAPAPAPVDDSAERERMERERMAREAAERSRAVAADLAAMINFDYDQATVRPADQATLDRKALILIANPNVKLRISGHADERGSDEYNLALGNRRAAAAKRYLENKGVDGLTAGRHLLRRGAASQPGQ